jgi:hypothetical protein
MSYPIEGSSLNFGDSYTSFRDSGFGKYRYDLGVQKEPIMDWVNEPRVRIWDPVRPPGLYCSVKSLQLRRLDARSRNNTEY